MQLSVQIQPGTEVLQNLKEERYHLLSSRYLAIVEDVYEYAQSAESQKQDTTKGTVFGVYNAITRYFQNVHEFSNPENKLKSIVFGTGKHAVKGL